MNSYDDGDLVRITGNFTDEDDDPIDPTTVSVQFRFGHEAPTTRVYGTDPEITKPSVGTYEMEISTTGRAGKHCYYRFSSTGTGQAAGEGVFQVNSSGLD
jgi:hypothetical protein